MHASPRLWIGLALTAVLAVGELVWIFHLNGKLGALFARSERLSDELADYAYDSTHGREKPAKGASFAGSGLAAQELRSLSVELRALKQRIEALEQGGEGAAGGEIDDIVDRKLGEKMVAVMHGRLGGTVSIDDFSAALGLDDTQKNRVADILNRSRDRIYELADTAIANQPELAKRMNQIVKSKDPLPKKIRRMSEMLSKVGPPGSDETYYDALVKIRDETLQEFDGTLNEEQLEKYKKHPLSLIGVNTGYQHERRGKLRPR